MTVTREGRQQLCSFVRTQGAATVISFRGTLRVDREDAVARALDTALLQIDGAVGHQRTGLVIADLSEAGPTVSKHMTSFLDLIGRRVNRQGLRFATVTSPADLSEAVG